MVTSFHLDFEDVLGTVAYVMDQNKDNCAFWVTYQERRYMYVFINVKERETIALIYMYYKLLQEMDQVA